MVALKELGRLFKVMEFELEVLLKEQKDWCAEREATNLAKTTLESNVITLEEEKKALVG